MSSENKPPVTSTLIGYLDPVAITRESPSAVNLPPPISTFTVAYLALALIAAHPVPPVPSPQSPVSPTPLEVTTPPLIIKSPLFNWTPPAVPYTIPSLTVVVPF